MFYKYSPKKLVEWYKVREVWRILQIDVRQRVDRKHSEDGRSVEALCCSHQASYCSSGFKQPFLTSTSCTTTTGSRSPALVLDPDWCSTCGCRAASNKESQQLGTAACGQCLVLAGFDGDVFILLFHLLFLVLCWIKHFLGLIHFLVLAPEWGFFFFFWFSGSHQVFILGVLQHASARFMTWNLINPTDERLEDLRPTRRSRVRFYFSALIGAL